MDDVIWLSAFTAVLLLVIAFLVADRRMSYRKVRETLTVVRKDKTVFSDGDVFCLVDVTDGQVEISIEVSAEDFETIRNGHDVEITSDIGRFTGSRYGSVFVRAL